jgi:DNA mismatch repair protein MutL
MPLFSIRKLDPLLAERISATEMIERPSHVVKECLENALDAGCTEICVCLEDAGKKLIEICDNGSGMEPEDLAICSQRHTTSKLQCFEDLQELKTLGFRGEALASIDAVSELQIISRTKKAASASFYSQGKLKKITFGSFLHATHGTQVRALGLFSKIPVRLKFLKSESAEIAHIREWMERIALAYPHVGFELKNNEKLIFRLRPETESKRVSHLLSDSSEATICMETLPSGPCDLGFQMHAYWVKKSSLPHTRKFITIVNHRAVKDKMLQQAAFSVFRQALMPGQFPAMAVFIEVHPNLLDVNVHPNKTEIRFLENKKIFSKVAELAKSFLDKQFVHENKSHSNPSDSQFQQPCLEPKENAESDKPSKFEENFRPETLSEIPKKELQGKYLGAVFRNYLVYEKELELVFIDQHAAHERIFYEKLRAIFSDPRQVMPSQILLIPQKIQLSQASTKIVKSNLKFLIHLGFEIETLEKNKFLVRSIPSIWKIQDIPTRFTNLLERLPETQDPFLDEELFESIATQACHSSIRSGDVLHPLQLQALAEQLLQCNHPWNCPHGRPTIISISEKEVKKWFQRT